MGRASERDEAIAEVTTRLKNYRLRPCLDCGGQGYTDMGKSACFWCRGAGVITSQMAHAFGVADRAEKGVELETALSEQQSQGWKNAHCNGDPEVAAMPRRNARDFLSAHMDEAGYVDFGAVSQPQTGGHWSDCADLSVADEAKAAAAVSNLIRKHVRLEWHGHDHADINHRSVTEAADAIIKVLRARHDEDELAGILHKAFSHPDAIDHSNEVVGLPKLIRTKGGWYVLGEDGMRFNLVCASRDPKAEARRA